MIHTPTPINGDAYTVAAPLVSTAALQKSVYNLTMRTGPNQVFDFARNSNMCFYGLSDYLEENLLFPFSKEDITESRDFMRSAHAFGYGMDFDSETWTRALDEFNGNLPIKIEGLPEGSTFFPGEPCVQVTSLGEGYGEMAAIVEAVLVGQVSIASSSLTMRRHLLARLEEYVREDQPNASPAEVRFMASIMIHDFGMRSHSNRFESAMLGRTHLLVFPGTDTFNAAYQAWVQAGRPERSPGTSIYALAHRTVQSHATQYLAFQKAIMSAITSAERSGGNAPAIVSLVSDCYDFNKTIEGDFNDICEAYPNVVGVARPDSGDYVANVLKIVTEAKNKGLFKTQPNGRIAMTSRRFIQGDAMTWDKIRNVMEALKANGFSPINCGIFGVGGWLRNIPNRDTHSAAYKLSAMGNDNTPVVKLSDTRAKLSVPGPVKVLRDGMHGKDGVEPTVCLWNEPGVGHNALVTYYDGSLAEPIVRDDIFPLIRDRVQNEFDILRAPENVWSRTIRKIQDDTFQKYGRNRNDFKY